MESSQKEPALVNQECRTSQPTSHGLGPTLLGQHTVNMEVLSPAVRAQAVLTIGKICLQVCSIVVNKKYYFSYYLLMYSMIFINF